MKQEDFVFSKVSLTVRYINVLTMSTSALESEDLENVPLVRMEDVQPSRTYELISRRRSDEEVIETCVINDIEYDNECIVNDDEDSNIGSMVSIQSEEVVEQPEDDSEAEMIVPELEHYDEPAIDSVLKPITKYQGLSVIEEIKKPPPSWPTLEILPGGVIKKPEKCSDEPDDCPSSQDGKTATGEMMYACAKCLQRFKFLFCLVKHVKWHEDEAKKLKRGVPEVKPKQESREYVCLHSNKRKMMICVKAHKKKTPKKLKS